MKVLVTGANGLLGANLVRELIRAGKKVKAFVRPTANLKGLKDVPCEIFHGDILSAENISEAMADCDEIIHAASTTSVMPVEFEFYKRINFAATENVVRAVLHQGNKRLVYVSTANAFGPGSKENPGSELSPFSLHRYGSGYINSKYMAQQYVLENVEKLGLNAVVVNPTFIIGPYDFKPSSGQIILHGLKRGVQWCPPGGKNFVYVRDVSLGIERALQSGRKGQCYLLAGENLTYKEFFSLLNRVAGRSRLQITIPKSILYTGGALAEIWSKFSEQNLAFNRTNTRLLCLDNYYTGDKAKNEFNVETTPIIKGIEEALNWFKKENYVSEDHYSTHGTSLDL